MPADPAPTSPAPAPAAPPSLLALMFAAVEQASEAVVITTADLASPGPTLLYMNPAFTRLTGYTAAEAVGWSPRLMQGPKTDAATTRQNYGGHRATHRDRPAREKTAFLQSRGRA